MPRSSFADMRCSVAQTLEIAGEWWTPMIVRDLAVGINRFDAIQRDLGVSRKVLSQRLDKLIAHDIVERVPYQHNPVRYDYWLTAKGSELALALLALVAWGDRWIHSETGPPLEIRHSGCGQVTHAELTCSCCGEKLEAPELRFSPGPGWEDGEGNAEVLGALERRNALLAGQP